MKSILSSFTSLKLSPLTGLFSLVFVAGCDEVPRTYNSGLDQIPALFSDNFSGPNLSQAWKTTGDGATVENGTLVVEGLHNHPVWLTTELPDDVVITFDVWSESEEGDIKIELAGDGKSFAKSVNYRASGYVLIFGGWNKRLHVIARQDEHGKDRKEIDTPRVEPNRRYHMRVTRDGNQIRWEVDDRELLVFDDPRPLRGIGHRHFAVNNWESRVHVDNLVIRPLS